MKRLTVRLEPATLRELRWTARLNERSLSAEIRFILKQHIADRKVREST